MCLLSAKQKTRLTKGSGVFAHNKRMLDLTSINRHDLVAAADLSLEDQLKKQQSVSGGRPGLRFTL
jgi:hypothetical protein